MSVRVLYFAWLRERVGHAEETLDPPAEATTLAAFRAWLATRTPGHRAALAGPGCVRAAVNQSFAADDAPIAPGDEIAFFPPVTGG